jgi:hypothetical protein
MIASLLGVSCGKQLNDFLNMGKTPHKKSITDVRFEDHIIRFENEFDLQVNIPIIFNKLESTKAGVCIKWSDGYREIQISPERWDEYSNLEQEQLLFHELGHCVFDLEHDDSMYMVAGYICPTSVMRSYMFSWYEVQQCYVPERNHYMEDINGKR